MKLKELEVGSARLKRLLTEAESDKSHGEGPVNAQHGGWAFRSL
jgi:hypothetical protein